MDRCEVIQKIIDAKKFKTYLEIGAASGEVFLNLRNLDKKIAVDPNFLYPMSLYRLSEKRTKEQYCQMTSNEYFDTHKSENIDLVFIDGLHSYKQVKLDIRYAEKVLSKNGIIVLHDCNPPHKAAATPANSYNEAMEQAVRGWTGEWCGDVWKICLMFHGIVTLNCDYGIGLLRKSDINLPVAKLDMDLPLWIVDLTYADLEKNRQKYLRLMPESYLDEFLR